jgi:hypothetical protein
MWVVCAARKAIILPYGGSVNSAGAVGTDCGNAGKSREHQTISRIRCSRERERQRTEAWNIKV